MLSKDYIIGLVDGEGSFTVFLRRRGKYRTVELHFYLKMREDELRLLRKVRKFFGCGKITFQKDRRRTHRNCYRFEIGNLKDLKEKVLPIFEKNLQSKKRRYDFKIFCQILKLVEKKKHLTLTGWKKIQKLKQLLHR